MNIDEGAAGEKSAAGSSSALGERRAAEEVRWSRAMVAAQAGDSAAYRTLLGELDLVLRSYLPRLLGESSLLEDAVQEALIAVHKARHTYDPRRPFRPWFLAIARHKAIDQLRRGRNPALQGASQHEEQEQVEPGAENRPGAALEVARMLSGLPGTFREAIVLTKLQGRTVEEAAAHEGVSATAMRSRVARGMRLLRRRFEEEPL